MKNKKILAISPQFYHTWPVLLQVPMNMGMVEVFFMVGSMIYYISAGIVMELYASHVRLEEVVTFPLHLELLGFGMVSLTLFAWVKWIEKRPISSLGFYKKAWLKELWLGFLLGCAQFSLSLLPIYLLGGVELKEVDLSGSTILYVLSIIPFWLIQGGTEELLTRGWLLPAISKRTNLALAVGLSSSLFGFMHLGNDHTSFLAILNIVLAGISMALYMLKRDNIWSVVGLHGAWNFIQGNIYGVAVSGSDAGPSLFRFVTTSGSPEWMSGGAFGTEGSLFATVVEVLLIAYLWYGLKKEKQSCQM